MPLTPTIIHAHRFFTRTSFYALTLSTFIGFGLLAARMQMMGSFAYGFLVWNLFLAWIPFWCAGGVLSLVESKSQRRGLMWFLAAIWLIFFPNAPYIVTDFKHLFDTPHLTWWYDIGLIASFAWTGCFLAVVSLQIMQSLVARRVGQVGSWIFVLATIGLSGVGIYIGRFLRFNSWDLITRPQEILGYVRGAVIEPLSHTRGIGVTLMFSAVLLVCYVTVASIRAAARQEMTR